MRIDDLTGKKFHRLLVLADEGVRKKGRVMWLCLCDCGKKKYVDGYSLKKGHTKSCGCWQRDVRRLSHTGFMNPAWKGGRCKREGYIFLQRLDHPRGDKKGYVPEHRLVMEDILGRYLTPKETVHHIDEDRTNNRAENLVLFASRGAHLGYHRHLAYIRAARPPIYHGPPKSDREV